ncbi:MAG: desulfoferrodoxin [Lachnospiraceae bacterium]|nr:desulfoferrodoxin [Lachnospiraceae bacterium]
MIQDSGVKVICCGQAMKELIPNTVDAAAEKHVPVAVRDGNKLTVNVGSVPHPMMAEHHIAWIIAAQEAKTQRVVLDPVGIPAAEFILDDGPVTIYEYCNIHGLWKAENNE